jgi:hypothetical protein
MREMKVECLIVRLSFFVFRKVSEAMVLGRWDGAGRVRTFEDDFARIEGRFAGAVGAWGC